MNLPGDGLASRSAVAPPILSHFRPISRLKNIVGRVIGDPVESGLDEYWQIVPSVKAIDLSGKTDSQLAERIRQIAHFLRAAQTGREAGCVMGLARPSFNENAMAASREGICPERRKGGFSAQLRFSIFSASIPH